MLKSCEGATVSKQTKNTHHSCPDMACVMVVFSANLLVVVQLCIFVCWHGCLSETVLDA